MSEEIAKNVRIRDELKAPIGPWVREAGVSDEWLAAQVSLTASNIILDTLAQGDKKRRRQLLQEIAQKAESGGYKDDLLAAIDFGIETMGDSFETQLKEQAVLYMAPLASPDN